MQSAIDALNSLAVHCRGVIKSYGEGEATVMALRGVDLDVRAGELLMVVGPSGCGKTTLVSVIAGILDQDSGQCEVLGHELKAMGRSEKTHFRAVDRLRFSDVQFTARAHRSRKCLRTLAD